MEFGKALAAARAAQGFATAFGFYKSRGGSKGLQLSFANYLRLERGKGLPQAWRLERILSALGLEPSSPQGRSLVRSYLKAALGSEKLLSYIGGAPDNDPAPQSWLLAESAARQAIGQRAMQLSLEQYQALGRGAANYRCHVILCNTKAWLDFPALAKAAGVFVPAAALAVKALKAVSLAEVSGRRARSPLAGKFVTPPSPTPAFFEIYSALRRFRSDWVGERGKLLQSPYLLLRAKKEDFARYFAHLSDAVKLSAVYGDVNPGEDSEMYLVDAGVYRLA